VITLLGSAEPMKWNYAPDSGTTIVLPGNAPATDGTPAGFAYAFRIEAGTAEKGA